MKKGVKIRFEIHKILFDIYKFSKTLNNNKIKSRISKYKEKDIGFIYNVTLSSMRYNFHAKKIIKKFVKKKVNDHEYILLLSSITQIVFLDFKEYAVVNCSVEIAKKLKLYHGFINAILKNISKEKLLLKEININFIDLPLWFKKEANNLTEYEKNLFMKNFWKKPNLHLVFKNESDLNEFDEDIYKTTKQSGFLLKEKRIEDINSYKDGKWWIQDFSSFFPINNFSKLNKYIKFLDICAAPGGKSFQLLSKDIKVDLNDKNKSRVSILKSNLRRLNIDAKVSLKNALEFQTDEKYDFIVLDAPCSSIGTIRKNPEILFKKKGLILKELVFLQKKMLKNVSKILNKNGLILYMVCSFFESETVKQLNYFLESHKNFKLYKFELKKENLIYRRLIKNDYMLTIPDLINNYTIDGYFAVFLKKLR